MGANLNDNETHCYESPQAWVILGIEWSDSGLFGYPVCKLLCSVFLPFRQRNPGLLSIVLSPIM